jgi:hypothetical protein
LLSESRKINKTKGYPGDKFKLGWAQRVGLKGVLGWEASAGTALFKTECRRMLEITLALEGSI